MGGVIAQIVRRTGEVRSSRLLDIIGIMRRARGPVSARALARTLEVSERTVYRDIVALQGMRVPIEGEAGVGYVMRPGFDLPPLMFTDEEAEAIAVGLSLIGRTSDAGLLAAASRAFAKISDVLTGPAGGRFDGAALQASHWNAIPPAPVEYRLLRMAIREERKLRLHYRDEKGRDSERTICPIALVYCVDCIILAAWCEMREALRHFRVDRMRVCTALDCLFEGRGKQLRALWRAEGALLSVPLSFGGV